MNRQALRATLAQTGMELRLTLRRGESVLLTLVVPLLLLAFFGATDLMDMGTERVAFLTPGLMALAIMSTGLVALSIATAYERHYGVLKRLHGTPLSTAQLVVAKLLAVLAVELVQLTAIGATALLFFGWQPQVAPLAFLVGVLLGTVAFAGLGLALAGSLRAESVLAVANGLYVLLLLSGSFVLPMASLPEGFATLAGWLPAAPLAELLRSASTDAAWPPQSTLVLAAWAAIASTLAVRTFRWE